MALCMFPLFMVIVFDIFLCLVQVADGTKHLPHLWDLCTNEIVVRSAKHILKVISVFSNT